MLKRSEVRPGVTVQLLRCCVLAAYGLCVRLYARQVCTGWQHVLLTAAAARASTAPLQLCGTGKYPRESVCTIASICRAAEAVFDHSSHYEVRGLQVPCPRCAAQAGLANVCALLAPPRSPPVPAPQYLMEAAFEAASTPGGTAAQRALQDKVWSCRRRVPSLLAQRPTNRIQHGHAFVLPCATACLTAAPIGSAGPLVPALVQMASSTLDLDIMDMQAQARAAQPGVMNGSNSQRSLPLHHSPTSGALHVRGTPYMSKLESIASSAVRAADKVNGQSACAAGRGRVLHAGASCHCGLPESKPPPLRAQVSASLIVVYTHTGQTAELVAKYRPPVPILTLVVPHLTSDKLKWRLEGR